MSTETFSIEFKYGCLKFANHTKFDVVLSTVPQKPKRKSNDIMLIPSGNFTILDNCFMYDEKHLDVFSFRFQKKAL